MGTSNSYGGPNAGNPLIPSWLDPVVSSPVGDGPPPVEPQTPNLVTTPVAPVPPLIPPAGKVSRFQAARSNFSRFASSGGTNKRGLGRAVSHYVSKSSGGAKHAAQRMGASRASGARLLSFLTEATANGVRETLRTLNLERLAGRPVSEIFLGLAEYICPDGGTIDEGIAREAFIETITELAGEGITDLDSLTADQVNTVFELYATNAIEARLCNDIGTNLVTVPESVKDAQNVQSQLRDFIRRSVADALSNAAADLAALTPAKIGEFVSRVYEQSFRILQSLGEAEVDQ